MYTILLVIHSIIVLFLIMIILVQRSDSDGLSGLGGGGGGNQFLTGRAQANLLTRTTAILAGIFMLTSLVLAVMAGHMTSSSIIDAVPASTQAPSSPTAVPANEDKVINGKAVTPADKAVEKPAPVKKQAPSVPKPE